MASLAGVWRTSQRGSNASVLNAVLKKMDLQSFSKPGTSSPGLFRPATSSVPRQANIGAQATTDAHLSQCDRLQLVDAAYRYIVKDTIQAMMNTPTMASAGQLLHTTGYVHDGTTPLYRARVSDCGPCPLKPRCCPKTPERKIPRSIHEDARDLARALVGTPAFEQSRRNRKRVEMLFAHLKRILRLGRLRLRGPRGAQDEFTLGAIAQNLRRLAKLVARPPPAAEPCPA